MTYVTELNLCHNRLSDISGLQCASSLQLPHHHIVMLLRYFPALRRLYLAHNSVNSLHALMPCQLLEVLDARSNDLVDLDGVIQVLRSLPHLSQVEMEGNPCAAHRLYKANLVASAGLKMLDGRFVVLYPLYCFHFRSFSRSVVTSLDVEGGRQMLLEAAPPSTPRGTAPRPVIRLSPPPNERLSSGRPTTAGGGAPSAAVQAATAAIAASAALSRNPIFLECVPARHFEILYFSLFVQICCCQCHRTAAAESAAARWAQVVHTSAATPCSADNRGPYQGGFRRQKIERQICYRVKVYN
jgi:hypothetical protein